MQQIRTKSLSVAFEDVGTLDGWPVLLLHGFPYDIHAFDDVVPVLVDRGARVIMPYLRGFGGTRFINDDIMRSGQQAALGKDVIELLDALGLERAMLAGYDWGGLASCVATALWPERVTGLVSLAGYDIIDVDRMRRPFPPVLEAAMWYQHLFQTERGRECLASMRRDLCRLLWEQWSPNWRFDDAMFEQTARSFENPDFVDVVIHAYRFAAGQEAGDPALEQFEEVLCKKPKITVPAVTLDGIDDPLKPGGTASLAPMFADWHEHHIIPCGHNLPQEAPLAFADAVLTVWKIVTDRA